VNVTARALVVVLLLSSSSLSAETAVVPPLQAAERALVNALMVPDRDAFRQLLASDAVFFLPVEARGPDAILEKWRPFLVSPEVRLALTIESSTISDSGDVGQTSGTVGVYGRTSKGMSTTSLGAFSIVWRLVDGQWKVWSLSRGNKRPQERRAN